MTLRVVGAGLGRTGTTSLKEALGLLLGGPCYHMLEVPNAQGTPMRGVTPMTVALPSGTRSSTGIEPRSIGRRLRSGQQSAPHFLMR